MRSGRFSQPSWKAFTPRLLCLVVLPTTLTPWFVVRQTTQHHDTLVPLNLSPFPRWNKDSGARVFFMGWFVGLYKLNQRINYLSFS